MDIRKNNNLYLLTKSPLWAIDPRIMPHLLSQLAVGFIPTWEATKPYALGKGPNKVAVIPVEGVLTKDGPAWLGSNYNGIASALESVAADATVKRVVLSVDSPGGEVTGLPETGALVAQVAKAKPVSAMVEGLSASAAYWLTSQASDITLTPSGEVGSVGVRMMHMDISEMMKQMGISVTELHAGNYKTEWSPFHPLTDEAKADMQTRINAVHEDFLTAVKAGRGVRASQEMAEQRFGEGRMMSAPQAEAHGMVDRLQASRDFYKAIMPALEIEDQPQQHGIPARRARLEVERKRF